jgi:hypothetical protein
MNSVVRVNQLRETQRASHARGSASDDDDVGFHLGVVDTF